MTRAHSAATATEVAGTTEVGVTVDSSGDFALLLLPVLVLVIAVPVAVWLLRARLRLRLAVLRYDWWLDLGGVSGRRRRELRQELHANLVDSATRVGTREAVRRLGPLRQLAAESADAARSMARPRWSQASMAAASVFCAVLVLEMLAAMWWLDGAYESGAPTVRGSLLLFPASAIELSNARDGFSVEFRPGWLILAAAAATFVLASRPWLLLRRGRDGASPGPVRGGA
jgi:hypothetical protein